MKCYNMKLFKNKLILAPMAGITEKVFRTICRSFGADIVVSEMVSAEGIFHNAKNTKELISFKKHERPFGVQLFGAHAGHLAYAAQYVEEHAQPDFIDLNSGCPVSKVVKRNGGSALLKDQHLFADILTQMVKAIKTPVTVKIRSGWMKGDWVDVEFAKIAEASGVSAITLHPRSKTMGFSGHSFWDRITAVKQIVNIPVIGNGDITEPHHATEMYNQTGCDSIMVGRGVYGNPWLLKQIKDVLSGDVPSIVTLKEKFEIAMHHLDEYIKAYSNTVSAKEMKKHIAWYTRGIPGASILRNEVFRTNSTEDLKRLLREVFKQN